MCIPVSIQGWIALGMQVARYSDITSCCGNVAKCVNSAGNSSIHPL